MKIQDFILLCGALACLVLLFVGGPGDFTPRSLRLAWNLGHVLCFLLWTRLLLTLWKRAAAWGWRRQLLVTLVLCLFLGGLTEVLQGGVGRSPDLQDVARDLLGGLTALAFFVPGRRRIPLPLRRSLQAGVLLVLLASAWPMAKALADELLALKQFPVLADFETPFESGRMWGNSRYRVELGTTAHGRGALRVELNTDRYSGVYLKHFPGDWRGFEQLGLEVFNPGKEPLELHFRIHDRAHLGNRSRYSDRFNTRFILQPGWNPIRVSLAEVRRAPRDRELDLSQVQGVGLFAAKLEQPVVIFLDHLRLLN
ncbi:hypothetical protein DESUT3_30460 [Desulfuromonas versatilis]|uniref:VanZ-like domain-containing protein n=1 Tax=Desulfuromonas versatilis TaxID=2802975 RepID=A0ABM8HZE6_9BACT|nr:VanZ family protein [Desulfuromonas versatilis]BCR05977.1 hypothetical protein DESUT3_30460 [Desulfuromonas versatilis]